MAIKINSRNCLNEKWVLECEESHLRNVKKICGREFGEMRKRKEPSGEKRKRGCVNCEKRHDK
jgi:hypothetical protein